MRTAAYVRYSSDNQREASLDDQLRNCSQYCSRVGWPAPTVFSDAAISGSHAERPGYRALIAAIERGEFDVLLVDDMSRLSRDSTESGRILRRLAWHSIRLVGVSDGTDTSRDGHELDTGIRAVINEHYVRDLAKKTHRGLTGRALDGASAGGLPYGYVVTSTGQRAIDPDQAAIVRRIFDAYLAGKSARKIAGELNDEGVPSPRGETWAASAIRADHKRGLGILANPIYMGQQVWNKSHWVKHPETRRRVRRERPPSEWITSHRPELAIIDAQVFEAAKRRALGRSQAMPLKQGRPPRHLLSGILRCGECGGPMVAVDRYRYGCARAKESGICKSRLRIVRSDAERALVAGITRELLSEEAFSAFHRAALDALKRNAPDLAGLQRDLAKAKAEHANLMKAIKAGIFTASTKDELEACERTVDAAEDALSAAKAAAPVRILPAARTVWDRYARDLSNYTRDIHAARTALRALLGSDIPVRQNEKGDPVAEIANSSVQINVVAGAGYVRSLTAAPFSIALR